MKKRYGGDALSALIIIAALAVMAWLFFDAVDRQMALREAVGLVVEAGAR